MKVAAVQYHPPKGDTVRARNEIFSRATLAADKGAQLIVFPEMATSGYVWNNREEIIPHAEKRDGPLCQILIPVAQKYDCWIICGFPEITDSSELYNSALIISPAGNVHCYRKILLYDADKTWAQPGDTRMILETPFGKIIPCICMDLNDDNFVDFVVAHRDATICFCTNWLEEGLDVHYYWQYRLAEYCGSLVAANRWGFDSATEFCGRSAIFGKGMRLAASAERTGDSILILELE